MIRFRSIPTMAFLLLAAPLFVRAEPGPSDATHAIAVKSVEALHVVFRQHQGSYWTIAPTVDLVRGYMDRLNEPGPLFVRYIQAPASATRQTFRIEVGFVTDQEPKVERPFQYTQRPAEKVAFMHVPPAHAAPSRALPRLRAWTLARGYNMQSILTEIHPLTGRGANAHDTVEVQLVISEQQAAVDLAVRNVENTPKTPKPVTRAATKDVPTQEAPTPKAVAQETVQPKGQPTTAVQKVEEVARRSKATNLPSQREPAIAQRTDIAKLARDGQYDRVAELVVPVGQEISPEESFWLGQVMFRFGAAARGVVRFYPDQAVEIGKLAEALDHRYRKSVSYARHNPLEQIVSIAKPRSDPGVKRRQAITRDLDRVLGRIAWQAGTAEEVRSALVGILVRVKNELASDENVKIDNQP